MVIFLPLTMHHHLNNNIPNLNPRYTWLIFFLLKHRKKFLVLKAKPGGPAVSNRTLCGC